MKYANKYCKILIVEKKLYLFTSKSILLIIFFILNIGTIAAENNFSGMKLIQEQIPVEKIDSEELYRLLNKEMIIRVLESYKDIHLLPESTETKPIIDHYKKLRPNFLAEIMFVMPVSPGEEQAVLQDVKDFLQFVKTFEDIPYYSKHNNAWVPMFDNITIKELTVFPDGSEGIITEQKMLPFKSYTSVYRYYLSEDNFLYKNYNSTPLYYKWMKGVDKEKMSTTLLVQAYPGYLFFYGLGGAKAFDFFGLFGNRLDTAFTGRVEAFFEWFHKEFVLEITAE